MHVRFCPFLYDFEVDYSTSLANGSQMNEIQYETRKANPGVDHQPYLSNYLWPVKASSFEHPAPQSTHSQSGTLCIELSALRPWWRRSDHHQLFYNLGSQRQQRKVNPWKESARMRKASARIELASAAELEWRREAEQQHNHSLSNWAVTSPRPLIA